MCWAGDAGMERDAMKWFIMILGAVTAATIVAQYVGPHAEKLYPWERVPLFWGLFGLAGTWVLVRLAKRLGKHVIQRDENYYNDR